MRPRIFNCLVMLAAVGLLFFQSGLIDRAAAQADKLTWDKKVEITRKPKQGRARPRRQKQQAPLLTIEYRIMKQAEDLTPRETNPDLTVFHTGDRLQIRLKTNQDGYLYIIQNTEGEDGQIIFPDSRINDGRNLVRKNEELVIPSHCESRYLDELGNCWFRMEPPAGREVFTVIFSRDIITDISDLVGEGGAVKRHVIEEILKNSNQAVKRTSRPDLSPAHGGGAGRFALWVTNINRNDNEELITDIVLLHKEREGSD